MLKIIPIPLIMLIFSASASAQGISNPCGPNPFLTAKSYSIKHNDSTSPKIRKEIEKAAKQASDIKKAVAGDLELDFSENGVLMVWQTVNGEKLSGGRWSLEDRSSHVWMPGSGRTTVVSAGGVTTAASVYRPARPRTLHTRGDVSAASEFLFALRVDRKTRKMMCK